MTSTAKKFMLFFVVSSLFVCAFYFAWAWSRGLAENAALRSQVTTLSDQTKNTEAAIATLRMKDEEAARAREIESKNELNLKEKYLKAQERSGQLERQLDALKLNSVSSKKTLKEALKRAEKAEKELKDKEVIVASQWRRIERLETRSKSLDQENQNILLEARRQREKEKAQEESRRDQDRQLDAQTTRKSAQDSQNLEREWQKTLKQKEDSIAKLTAELKKSRETEKLLREELKKAESKKAKPQNEFRDLTKKVQALTQDSATAHYNLGVLYMRGGQYKSAAMEFEYALTANPSDASAHYNLAVILDAYLKDPKGAIEHYEAYMRLQPNAEDFQKVQYRVFKMRIQESKGVGKDLGIQS